MRNLEDISRAVYRHDWTSLDEWVGCLDELAELSDDEICELERLGTDTPTPVHH